MGITGWAAHHVNVPCDLCLAPSQKLQPPSPDIQGKANHLRLWFPSTRSPCPPFSFPLTRPHQVVISLQSSCITQC